MKLHLAAAAALTLLSCAAVAEEAPATKIGFITTLSGPAGYLGADMRDGFLLATTMKGGPFDDQRVDVMVEDDGLKPGQGKQIAERMLKNAKAKIFTGVVFGNIASAVVPDILDSNAIFVASNTAGASFAGKDCDKNYFVASWQNDSQGESADALAQREGYESAYLLAPNYESGKEALAAFQRTFKGRIVAERFTRLDQTDFSVEIADIRASGAKVLHVFEPGGLGIAFLRQFHNAHLLETVPIVAHAATLDQATVRVLGDAALGVQVTSQWNQDLDNPANVAFVAAWRAKYGNRPVTSYAAQGYDAALLIGTALKEAGGDQDIARVRDALRGAHIASVRGNFRFGPNQHPIQDWYALEATKTPSGEYELRTKEKVLTDHGDVYASECKM